jgi:serine/threonine protein kinase
LVNDQRPDHHRQPGSPPPAWDEEPSWPSDLLDQFDEYRLLDKLGEGGMGAVYKAVHTRLEKLVAIKVLPKERMRDPDAKSPFQREIKAVGRLNHAHLVQAHDAREVRGTTILVMEYVDGLDVSALAGREGQLRVADASEIVRQAALGL